MLEFVEVSKTFPDGTHALAETNLGQPPMEGLTAEDVVTNEFIDESIGL